MRLIHTFDNEKHGLAFANFLNEKEIENQFDIMTNTDWGSSKYGDYQFRLWIIDEDDVDEANRWLMLFLRDPDDSQFYTSHPIEETIPPPISSHTMVKPRRGPVTKPMTILTMYLLVMCTLLFLFTESTGRPIERPLPQLPLTPLYASPAKKAMLFDYPKAFELLDQLVNSYGIEPLVNLEQLPEEGKLLLLKFNETPYWQGVYPKLVGVLKTPSEKIEIKAPLFEKIKQGELWRLISPAFLHNDIFHLFFNMIWLLVLGKQIEMRLGFWKYALFIILAAIPSNLAQYMMSGANFIGFSGVLCAMIMFVWCRQKRAPWEGYQLLPATMGFITAFILTIVGIQMISFVFEIQDKEAFAPPIANTAHIAGAFCGYLLSKMKLFAWNSK